MMRCIAIFLLAAAAFAEESSECGTDGDTACAINGQSLLQHSVSVNKMVTEQQLLEREESRRNNIVDGIVERRLIILASLIREGIPPANAVALIERLAEKFHVDHLDDLTSSSTLRVLIQESAAPLKSILCHIRRTDDCGREWQEYLVDALTVLSDLGSSFLQALGGKPSKATKTHSLVEKGQVDIQLLSLLSEHLLRHMKVIVKSGETPSSTRLLASDAMSRLKAMDQSSMLVFQGYSMAQLAKKYFLSVLHTACLPATTSCVDRLSNEIWATDEILTGEGGTSTMLLQVGLRSAIQVVMKVFGLPELPEETAGERAVAVEAYLKQRSLEP